MLTFANVIRKFMDELQRRDGNIWKKVLKETSKLSPIKSINSAKVNEQWCHKVSVTLEQVTEARRTADVEKIKALPLEVFSGYGKTRKLSTGLCRALISPISKNLAQRTSWKTRSAGSE